MMKTANGIKYVVGIGASAGGLEALLSLFSKIRPSGQAAYVVAQHMAKNGHDELVLRLISRESLLPVTLAEEGMHLQPDKVYIIPSGMDGRIKGEQIHLMAPVASQISTPSVNVLFNSLAEASGTKAMGIILSGTGYDGTLGCKAIKARGGLTLAQNLEEAKFNGMPSSAINAHAIDHLLTVDQIANYINDRLSPGTSVKIDSLAVARDNQELKALCIQIYKATGIDFSEYKEETLLRRLEKRKETLGVHTAQAYQKLISIRPEELHQLQQLFLVSVSSFFRDSESFAVLKIALEKQLKSKNPGEPIRVWIPGCATGEEAYTMAIILKELTLESTKDHPIQIFACDLNQDALAVCQEGLYKGASFKEMPREVRSRHFMSHGERYEISPEIRSYVKFEHCDILGYIPPADIDIVSCRNLLIYLKSNLQDQVIRKFYDCLRPQGLLFIGQSESLSFTGSALFAPVDNYHRLFRKRN